MDAEQRIIDRYRFNVPPCYRAMRQAGCFDAQHEQHLQLTDLEWLSLPAIADYVFDKHLIDGLVPFAQTLDGHLWAWYPAIDERHQEAVVFCPDEDEVAVLYAPDFETAIYRMFIDELANTFLVERTSMKQAQEQLQQYSAILSPFIKESWAARVQSLADRSLQSTQTNFYGVINEDELQLILEEDIVYDRLDEEFCCVKETG